MFLTLISATRISSNKLIHFHHPVRRAADQFTHAGHKPDVFLLAQGSSGLTAQFGSLKISRISCGFAMADSYRWIPCEPTHKLIWTVNLWPRSPATSTRGVLRKEIPKMDSCWQGQCDPFWPLWYLIVGPVKPASVFDRGRVHDCTGQRKLSPAYAFLSLWIGCDPVF